MPNKIAVSKANTAKIQMGTHVIATPKQSVKKPTIKANMGFLPRVKNKIGTMTKDMIIIVAMISPANVGKPR